MGVECTHLRRCQTSGLGLLLGHRVPRVPHGAQAHRWCQGQEESGPLTATPISNQSMGRVSISHHGRPYPKAQWRLLYHQRGQAIRLSRAIISRLASPVLPGQWDHPQFSMPHQELVHLCRALSLQAVSSRALLQSPAVLHSHLWEVIVWDLVKFLARQWELPQLQLHQ